MNTYENAYSLIALVVTLGTWWSMFEYFSTPNQSQAIHLAWMATFGLAAAAIAGALWPLTLLGFICVAAVTAR
jgi:hypothetical protein